MNQTIARFDLLASAGYWDGTADDCVTTAQTSTTRSCILGCSGRIALQGEEKQRYRDAQNQGRLTAGPQRTGR